jgi:HAD superfamily hydrolase (TIGR01549 family)
MNCYPSEPDQPEPLLRPAALLLDMDGTITEPMLDFPKIKSEMGIGDRPILEAMAEMSDGARTAAEAVLLRHEQRAAAESALNCGCVELLDWAREQRLPTALITRNSRASVSVVLERHGLKFDVLITREDARFKPHPEPLHKACMKLGVSEAACWMIGDGRYDVESGTAAGVPTVWLSHGRAWNFGANPWRVVKDLPELLAMLRLCVEPRSR